jgi:transposase InsO family protein
LSQAECNYTTIEREGLSMIYTSQKFRHYLLGSHFKFFTDHSALKYLVNKPMLEGRICRWFLLFQEFSFEVIIKPERCNVRPDHLSRLDSGESGGAVDDHLPDADLFRVEAIPEYLEDITVFLSTGAYPETYSATHKRHMVVRVADYKLIGQLYKLGLDSILRRCVLDHERQDILWECHSGVAGGHVGGKATAQKVLQDGLWWATLFKDAKVYARSCDVCQRVGKPSRRDELPLQPVRALHAFEKWAVDFIGPINPTAKHSKASYIITVTDYLTRWAEAVVVQDCSIDIAARFIFENIITRFGCPRSLTSDQGAHFISSTIAKLTTEFLIQHHKSNPYHPQANGTVEAFNKILERELTKVCCANREDWDDRVPTVLWAYKTTTKTPQVHSISVSLWERGCGACRIHHSKLVHCTDHTHVGGRISFTETHGVTRTRRDQIFSRLSSVG